MSTKLNLNVLAQIMVKKTTQIIVNVRELGLTTALGLLCFLRKPINNTTVQTFVTIVYDRKEEDVEKVITQPVVETTSTSCQTTTDVDTTCKEEREERKEKTGGADDHSDNKVHFIPTVIALLAADYTPIC
ncbi:hypothetical protein ACFE04_000891 [Oxalis oulophora]